MKRITIFLLFALALLMMGCATTTTGERSSIKELPAENASTQAKEAELPSASKIAEESVTVTEAPPFEAEVDAESNRVKIKFPVRPDQYDTSKKEERLAQDPQIKVYASYRYEKHVSDGENKWVQIGKESFLIDTGELQDGQVTAYLTLPEKGTGWFSINAWAKDFRSDSWVWIDESSKFCRYDKQGRPGYEFLGNINTGQVAPVPSGQERRQ